MKPRNEREREVMKLHDKLPKITEKQKKWAIEHCHDGVGYKSGDIVWCTKCGCEFGFKDSVLGKGDMAVCPMCSERLTIEVSRKRKIERNYYYTIVTTIGGWQVLRHYLVEKWMCKVSKYIHGCQEPQFTIREAVQNWIDEKGNEVVVARARKPYIFYNDIWDFRGKMSIKGNYNRCGYQADIYNVWANFIYPYMSVMPVLRRNGLKGKLPDVPLKDLMVSLIKNPQAETLLKSKQFKLLEGLCRRGYIRFWGSVKIAIRNNYIVGDYNLWNDMLEALEYLGKDLHNAHYVCPVDMKEAHDEWIRKRRKKERKETEEKRRKDAIRWSSEYVEKHQNFFGICIKGNGIVIEPIRSVDEMQEEADYMRHCVMTGEYYKRDDSLILSAKKEDGERLETIEVDINTVRVVQCFGRFNSFSDRHNDILELMDKNIGVIRKVCYERG